ncbi:hypothetical protein [Rhodococcus phenolicus]|uniref:hypothetical protein n=1 Tax=Rhodococcus phenolicus TaxID=263849 RepID=UPI001FDED9BA|nr:hypothetical protein [Rhodococcus phenolicus]
MPREHPQAEPTTTKPTARKRPRKDETRPPAHPRSTPPINTHQPEISSTVRGGTTDTGPAGTVCDVVRRSFGAAVEALENRIHQLVGVQNRGDLAKKIRKWIDPLVDEVAHGSVGIKAGLAGLQAVLAGKNPVWAAIKGLVSGLSLEAKIGLVLVLTLGLLLGPVLLVVLLLALLVVVVVAVVRAVTE